jgi:hypothetical protein
MNYYIIVVLGILCQSSYVMSSSSSANSALYTAILNNNYDACVKALEAGADPNDSSSYYMNPPVDGDVSDGVEDGTALGLAVCLNDFWSNDKILHLLINCR